MIYLLTGQPGSGKTSIGKLLVEQLSKVKNTIQIDGDDLRDIFNNTDYSEIGRRKNIEKAHDIAFFLNKKGFDVVISLVSPYRDLRELLKLKTDVIEIYVNTTDIRGRENYFVTNYESPIDNFLNMNTTKLTVAQSVSYLTDKFLYILDKK
jgi:adenylylsulfate kinase